MTIFEYVTVAVSIILGLAIARMLSALTDLFVHKDRVRLHWIPLVWVVTLFFLLITFWWQLFNVSQLSQVWSYLDFVVTITIAILFFVASSLLLPRYWLDKEIGLYDFYSATGRWGVAANATIFLAAIAVNFQLWDTPIMSMYSLLDLITFITGIGAFLNRSVRQAGFWTIAYVLALVSNVAYILNPAYGA